MQDVFNFLTELAIDPFKTIDYASRPPEQRASIHEMLRVDGSAASGERIAGGHFEACRTCSDPGPDEPFPDFEDQVSS
ncbi:MAG TPA: hypothetical protein VFQ61_24940 [Polyangiaceae bacterium]|nr:hypothetical protein [Polyangiaceae bacterium]